MVGNDDAIRTNRLCKGINRCHAGEHRVHARRLHGQHLVRQLVPRQCRSPQQRTQIRNVKHVATARFPEVPPG